MQLVTVANSAISGLIFPTKLQRDSAALIQGFDMVDEEDAEYNDGWLGSESVLRLTAITDSSSSKRDVQISMT